MFYTFCIPVTFNNPIKACFWNKKYPFTIQTRAAQIVSSKFLNEKLVLKGVGVQNELTITFVQIFLNTHTNFYPLLYFLYSNRIKIDTKTVFF